MIKYIVVWSSYNDWNSTRPFDSESEAQKHADTWLIPHQKESLKKGDKYHYADIQIIPIEVKRS